jgi:hypothetical protein
MPAVTKPMSLRVLRRVRLGDNREVRIVRIPTGTEEDLIRIGINMRPGGESMSGAVFPESFLPEVVDALQEIVKSG